MRRLQLMMTLGVTGLLQPMPQQLSLYCHFLSVQMEPIGEIVMKVL